MTVAAASPINSYTGNSSANTFAFTFPVFSQSHLLVTVIGPSPATTVTILVLGIDYTVTGLSPSGDPASTGSIVLVSSGQAWLSGGNLATGYSLVIQINMPLAQTTSIRNQGDYYRSTLENALDALEMQIQQIQLAIGAQALTPSPVTIPLPIGSGGTASITALANGKLMQSSAGKIVESTVPVASGHIGTAPTVQKFTSGSGTYTLPSNPTPLYIRVRAVGGGGGGGGSGTTGNGGGGNAGNTTFGTSLIVCTGGSGGGATPGASSAGAGGTASLGSGPIGLTITGESGSGFSENATSSAAFLAGPKGGSTPFGGGACSSAANVAGASGGANTGEGGQGGGGALAAACFTGNGGGGGGYVDAIIPSPSATYPYSVGGGGTAGTPGTSGFVGGAGGSGLIVVEEYYQ